MIEREKWLRVAETFATPPEEMTAEQVEITSFGLCHAYTEVSGGNVEMEVDIIHRMEIIGEQTTGRYEVSPFCYDGNGNRDRYPMDLQDCRCLLACLFAAMSAKERREIGLPG